MSNDKFNRGGIRIDLEQGAADTAAFSGNIAVLPILNTTPDKIKILHDLALSDIKLSDFPVVHMDMSGYCIWPELETLAKRPQNPFKIKPEVAKRLNEEIFPFWLERRTVQEAARYSDYDTADYANDRRDEVDGGMCKGKPSIDPPLKKSAGETPKCQELFERVAFYLSDKATAVSHTTPDFGRVLHFGFNGLIAQLQKDIASGIADTPEKIEFAQSVIAVYEGAKIYAGHLAEAAEEAGNNQLAAICRKVPAEPADTLAEAIIVIWICYHLLLQENTNFGLSLGRLDRTLNEFYLRDWQSQPDEAAKTAYTKRAVELMCHFLRYSDHVPLSPESAEALFAGSGSNQALTVGGARWENGQTVDAVNDMTYIILKATEMLSIRDPNVHARYHKDVHHRAPDGSPLAGHEISPYLKRICQVNLVTRATPALHGDAPVIRSMGNYYARHDHVSPDEALADAHDYASIGCIEQNADHKHYGHTGSTLLVLPAVLELAMFGGKHRSDGTGKYDPNLFYGKPDYTSPPLTAMTSMQEFIGNFRFQLDEMARHCVQFNNYLGETPGGIYNNAMAVKYTRLLTQMIQEVFFKYRTHRGGRYLTGYWSMTNHAGFGMLSRATPNGRVNNASFASGITPCPGIVKANGDAVMLLDHMLSVASVDPDTVQNGYTYNLSLTPRGKAYFDEDTELSATHMKTFMDQDGVLVQLCVTSIEDFIAANAAATAASRAGAGEAEQKALAPYKDLMIRVAGYSAYYVTLSPLMRQEIIDRANFAMQSGVEQHATTGA